MQIEEADFKLTSVDESSPFFDLELLYKIQPKDKEARYEFKDAAYGIPIESAIKRIAQYRVHCRNADKAIRLKQYFKEFKEEINNLMQLCNYGTSRELD